ncbi:MAG: ACT domain-containing protein [Oscillospiraceae bacterium]|jgi:hypothetical protein|nr:ACT domain-containing protein [Oscillospiraceae bacterium]
MAIDQLSVFVENKPGKLVEVLEAIGASGVDLRALSIADTADYGVLRVIVDRPVDALKLLTDLGFVVRINQVLPVSIDDKPGALANTLRVLSDAGVSVEYLYAFVAHGNGRAFVILRVEDNEAAEAVLRKSGIAIAAREDIYRA